MLVRDLRQEVFHQRLLVHSELHVSGVGQQYRNGVHLLAWGDTVRQVLHGTALRWLLTILGHPSSKGKEKTARRGCDSVLQPPSPSVGTCVGNRTLTGS